MHPKQQLEGTGVRPKKSFGQNFLADDTHLDAIARLVAGCTSDRTVVELGAGLGALTHHLVHRHLIVHAVERDRDLVPLLRKRFAAGGSLVVHEDNALTIALDGLLGEGGCLCGNLPYHLAASLCMRALDQWPHLGGAVFLLQLEVAERIASGPGTKDYGVLSVLLQSRFTVENAHVVPAGAFWPVPEVDGGVIVMKPRPPVDGAPSIEALKRVVKGAFQQRRKTMKNSLKALGVDDAMFARAGIDPGVRAEDVPVHAFEKLAHVVAELRA